jgi:hypothetical protein
VDGKRSSQTFVAYTQLHYPRLAQVKTGRPFLFQHQHSKSFDLFKF